MSNALMRIDMLQKSFGALHVTRDVSLSVRMGECVALIGPNGAGKTTLIHQISGVLKPDAGRIFLRERDITALSVHQRAEAGLGRTFQIAAPVPSFTVLENVATAVQARHGISFRFFGNAARERRLNDEAAETLAILGLESRAERPARDLSHGETRLLDLAIALAGKPDILLLDEPMAGLGREEGHALIETLRTLKQSVPMLLIEHDMDAVFALADRVAVLVEGSVVAEGTPEEVRRDPKARAAYLGDDEAAPC